MSKRIGEKGIGAGGPSSSEVAVLSAARGQCVRCGPDRESPAESATPRSPIWQRYEGRLSRLVEQSRAVRDTEFARRQVEEAAALAAAAITDAAAADLAKSKCLAHMSHELRTPLSAIIGFAEVIAQILGGPAGSKDKALEYANDIKDAGHHLLDLVNDILDFTKVEAGKLELNEELLDFPELAQSCVAMVRGRASASGITLRTQVPEACAGLTVDGRKLKQVLVNLLSNAVKFTPQGGRVELTAEPNGSAGVAISVTDSGVGMSAEERALALEPFTQLRRDLLSDQPGTGLGLPLAKALVELHGGSLTIESAPDKGTTVRIVLPRARAARGEAPELAVSDCGPRPQVA